MSTIVGVLAVAALFVVFGLFQRHHRAGCAGCIHAHNPSACGHCTFTTPCSPESSDDDSSA